MTLQAEHDHRYRSVLDAADCLIDESVGVIHNIGEIRNEPGGPEFFRYVGEYIPFNGRLGKLHRASEIQRGGGASTDRQLAFCKAVGECAERYCLSVYDQSELPLVCSEEALFRCVPPGQFALCTEAQCRQEGFPFVHFSKRTPVRWVPCREARTSEIWYVPAPMVFVPYYPSEGEANICTSISTGAASHTSYQEAAIRGICEAIERDAFTITWQAMVAPPRVRIESLAADNQDLILRFDRAGYDITLFDLTTDFQVPAILVLARGRGRQLPPVSVSAGCSLNSQNAAKKALEELGSLIPYALWTKRTTARLQPDPTYTNVREMDDHLNFYLDEANIALLGPLLASDRFVNLRDSESAERRSPERVLATLLDRIEAAGEQVFLADITSPDIEDAGFKVIKAIMPGCHPLCFGHRFRVLGGRRLWEVPQRLGYRGINRTNGDNPAPHPFA